MDLLSPLNPSLSASRRRVAITNIDLHREDDSSSTSSSPSLSSLLAAVDVVPSPPVLYTRKPAPSITDPPLDSVDDDDGNRDLELLIPPMGLRDRIFDFECVRGSACAVSFLNILLPLCPPPRTSFPYVVIVLMLFATSLITAGTVTAEVAFLNDIPHLTTTTVTMWSVKIATTSGVLGISSDVEGALFPHCSNGIHSVVVALRCFTILTISLSVVSTVVTVLDGFVLALRRSPFLVLCTLLCACSSLRWGMQWLLFDASFCGEKSLNERGYIFVASLTSNVFVVTLPALSLLSFTFFYSSLHLEYPQHIVDRGRERRRQLQLQHRSMGDSDPPFREPLALATAVSVLLAV